METLEAISKRRSIRKFLSTEIPKEIIEQILNSAIEAPSGKNRQPWKFIIITNKEKADMLRTMQIGIENEKKHRGLLPNSLHFINGAENTMKIMEQAPITVFVFNTENDNLWNDLSIEDKLFHVVNIQSIGACIQNMLLAATDLGIGSLWICDVFFAYKELCQWLNENNQMIAAISFGYADENPNHRSRKKLDDIVQWR